MALSNQALLVDDELRGAAWCEAHTRQTDAWLAELLQKAVGDDTRGLALVAVGGYGRAELCPNSDIDVVLLHDRRSDAAEVAERVWYPIWDAGLHLGHSVSTVKEALNLAADDLDTATAIMSARHVAGDPSLAAQLADRGRTQWERRAKGWLRQLANRVHERHRVAGEVAFLLEPDLKDGRGGLRDVHSLRWAVAAGHPLHRTDASAMEAAYEVLLEVRVELQRRTGRAGNLLTLDEQDAVAAGLGYADADALMAAVASAAKGISWISDDTWRRAERPARRTRRATALGSGISLVDGEVVASDEATGHDPIIVLRVLEAAATNDAPIERRSLHLLAEAQPLPDPWPAGAAQLLIDGLRAGRPAIGAIEALDQCGAWGGVLPEWAAVRSLPQRNAYHRFTVDRHLLEAAAAAAELAGAVTRPDLLVIGALLHDIGKGSGGDHTVVGMAMAGTIGARAGLPEADVATLVAMVEHHLLLADAATRRDLDDNDTIRYVADRATSVERLALLAALTEADSIATGPSAWGPWKAELVRQLTGLVASSLRGEHAKTGERRGFPTPDQVARLAVIAAGDRVIDVRGDTVTVMTGDRPGVFSRIAGVLALHGLDVLSASAHSSDDGKALAEFRVVDRLRTDTPWARVTGDLERALDGRLALNARVSDRARTYGVRGPTRTGASEPVVVFHNDASSASTVIDVQTADRVGVLYRITRALAELDLDIRSAKAHSVGDRVFDAFYVRDRRGGKVIHPDTLEEVRRAIVHSVAD